MIAAVKLEDHTQPINADARRLIQPMRRSGKLEDFTEDDCRAIRWKGAIEKCRSCGDRVYRHGWCFGCGRSHGG
jgi:hypothetical protein